MNSFYVQTTGNQQSSRLKSLQDCNSLLILPKANENKLKIEKNSIIECYLIDTFENVDEDIIKNLQNNYTVSISNKNTQQKDKNIYSVATITISDRAYKGEYEKDESTSVLKEYFSNKTGYELKNQKVIPDDKEYLINTYNELINENIYNLILTSGGTGLTARDITPEATISYIEKRATGIEMLIMTESLKITKFACLSRPIVGIKNSVVIITLPGSPKAIKENLSIIESILPHALNQVTNIKDFH